MKYFIENVTPTDIGIALALAVIALTCIRYFLWKLDDLDRQWAEDTAMDSHQEVMTEESFVASMRESGVSEHDISDMLRGTKFPPSAA